VSKQKPILVVAGDAGGARAILPALSVLKRNRYPFEIVEHRFLAAEAPSQWKRVQLPSESSIPREWIDRYDACLFGTSVRDVWPLTIARAANAAGVPTITVLDNWMSYRKRLETDGQAMFLPNAYAVMDNLARDEAVADGVPAPCLHIVGHPGLARLAEEFLAFDVTRKKASALIAAPWSENDARLLLFISEPAEKDQGANEQSATFRGYTEKNVLSLFAEALQPFHNSVQIGLVPHPRENAVDLMTHWNKCRGKVKGGLLPMESGREAVFLADGVCGMASLLLLEALLLGKPVISLQPGLQHPHLDFLKKKGLKHFVTSAGAVRPVVGRWMKTTQSSASGKRRLHPELALHRNADESCAALITAIANRTSKNVMEEGPLQSAFTP
jgi:hypothetical protein